MMACMVRDHPVRVHMSGCLGMTLVAEGEGGGMGVMDGPMASSRLALAKARRGWPALDSSRPPTQVLAPGKCLSRR